MLATDPFPPFHSPEVKGYGFFAEIVQAAFKEVGHDLKIEFVPWNRAFELSQTGYYDGVIGALYSDDRAKNYLFCPKTSHCKCNAIRCQSKAFIEDFFHVP